jgi:hypothetical protein
MLLGKENKKGINWKDYIERILFYKFFLFHNKEYRQYRRQYQIRNIAKACIQLHIK